VSFDLFFARPDPSGRTVERKNPFTGAVSTEAAMLPLTADEFGRLAKRIADAGLGGNVTGDGLRFEATGEGWDFGLDPEGGSAGISTADPKPLAAIMSALHALKESGFRVVGPGVDSAREAPLDEQIAGALGLAAAYADQVRARLRRVGDGAT
jgi:hypothetical protein